MGFWTNHRQRQGAKAALRMERMQRQQITGATPPAPASFGQSPWHVGYAAGKQAGYDEGWRAGQKDLVQKILSGELAWDDAVRRLT